MTTLETNEIQGIILRGYGAFPVANFVLLHVNDSAKAKLWLNELIGKIAFGINTNANAVCNIAFTYEGLQALGLNDLNLRTFSPELREGMFTPHRQRVLGDEGESDPRTWRWGGPTNQAVHILLSLYAVDDNVLAAYQADHETSISKSGLSIIRVLDSLTLPGRKEHFGFRDGIAQPSLREDPESDPRADGSLGAGEFILGYRNQYDLYPDSPSIVDRQGNMNLLPEATEKGRDFGRNGSYLVFRQLEQKVQEFWKFLAAAEQANGNSSGDEAIRIASKMLGRWPSGAPLMKFPDRDPGGTSDDDDFLYRAEDAEGLRCPLGSHIRRTNPRDSLQDSSVKQSLKLSSRRRMIRRGRAYGLPLVQSMDPRDMINAAPATNEMGLLFLCFNASIANQFEFVQNNWANNRAFENFYADPDPYIGVQSTCPVGAQQNFTIPRAIGNQRVTDLKRFVEVRGGSYFFMPSLSALRYLVTIEENPMSQVPQVEKPKNADAAGFLSAFDAIPKSGLAPADAAKAQYQLLATWLTTKAGPLFAELREQRPVLVPAVGPVLISRYADAIEALDLFDIYTVKPASDAVAVVGAGAPFLLGMDDIPERERDQSILRLAVKRTDADLIRSLAAAESKKIVSTAAGKLDLVKSYGSSVPLYLAGSYFGIPGPDVDTLRGWLRAMFTAVFRNPTHDAQVNQQAATNAAAYRDYVSGLVAAAHKNNGSGDPNLVLNRLVAMQGAKGASFTDEEITFNLSSLLMGMIDTTNAALNSAVDVLIDRADQLKGATQAARSGDDQLLMRYINEALRFSPPVPLLARLSVAEHSFETGTDHQTTVPAGRLVYVAIGSAMMDQRALQNPTEFRLDRPDHHYLHLGWGMHRCFGKYVAQTMLVEMMKALLAKNNLRRAEGAAGHPRFEGPFLASFTVQYDA